MMADRREKQAVQRVFKTSLSGLREDPFLAQRVLNAARGKGETMVKKKISVGFVIVVAVMMLSVTALASGIVMKLMTGRIAEMEAQGQFIEWGLEEKIGFVMAMRESGYDMNEADWAVLSDDTKPPQEREAAADRIVYARYGAVQEEMNARRPMPKESVMGDAPDAVEIFRERFLAENPNADEYDYMDALGYWLRDEYGPKLRAALSQLETPDPQIAKADSQDNALTREMAEESMRSHMTEVFGWPYTVAKSAVLASGQDAESGAWHVATVVPKEALKDAFEPVLEDEMIEETENGYAVAYWVMRLDDGGWRWAASLEALLAEVKEANRQSALYTIYIDRAEDLALTAIAEKYALSAEEIKRYFVYEADTYWDDPSCIRVGIMLRTRNNSGAPWDYAAIVNFTTAQVDDVFTPSDLPEKAKKLAQSWDSLQENKEYLNYLRWFSTWNPYGGFDNMPETDRKTIQEAFLEHAQKQKEAVTKESGYYPLSIFRIP